MALFAISYDSVEILRDFAATHGITYHLLSDDGSHAMRGLGLINDRVQDDHAWTVHFNDPDGHPLELVEFPADQGAGRWRRPTDRVFLGIDHSAAVDAAAAGVRPAA